MKNNMRLNNSTIKSGLVSFIGSPNVGKSTLLNALVGEKISIVTHKAQTTQKCIRGIVMHNDTQLILMDTPGIFSPSRFIDNVMINSAFKSMNGADVICLIYNSCSKTIDQNVKKIIKSLNGLKVQTCLIMNKIDLIEKKSLLTKVNDIFLQHKFDKVFMISALKKHGLKDLVSWLANQMPHGPHLFDSNEISDSPIRLMISEILREKLIINTHQEIPYNLLVSTDSWKENSDKSITIHQIIYVEKESHKKIIIGKSGKTIKNIGIVARKEMQTFLNTKVNLFLRVKVKHKCLNDPILFKSLGLDIND